MVLALDPYPAQENKRGRQLHKFVMKPLFAPHKDVCFCIGHVRDSHWMPLTKVMAVPAQISAPSPTPDKVKEEVKKERPLKKERLEVVQTEIIDLTL